jgi:hypothetical protein
VNVLPNAVVAPSTAHATVTTLHPSVAAKNVLEHAMKQGSAEMNAAQVSDGFVYRFIKKTP